MKRIRKTYGVPARIGMRVYYKPKKKFGVIVGSQGMRLRIRLEGEKWFGSYHPTWEIDYDPVM